MLDRVNSSANRGFDAVRAVSVRGGGHARLVGFFHPGAQLRFGQLLRSWLDAWRHDATRGDEFDAIGARLELLADRFADVLGPIRLASDPGAVPARHADHQVGRDDARALDESARLCVAQGRVGAVAAAQRSHGGEAGLQGVAGVDRRPPAAGRVRLFHLAEPIGATAHREVDVAVDQTGQQRRVGCIDPGRVGRGPRLSGRDLDDAVALDPNPGVFQERVAIGRGEDLASANEKLGHVAMLPSTEPDARQSLDDHAQSRELHDHP